MAPRRARWLVAALFWLPCGKLAPARRRRQQRHFIFSVAHMVRATTTTTFNTEAWRNLTSSLSPEKDFLLKYDLTSENIAPQGFSGCGVWVGSEDPKSLVWGAEPLLVGTVHSHLPKSSLLVATRTAKNLGDRKAHRQFSRRTRVCGETTVETTCRRNSAPGPQMNLLDVIEQVRLLGLGHGFERCLPRGLCVLQIADHLRQIGLPR